MGKTCPLCKQTSKNGEWETTDEGYSIHEFYMDASDSRGHNRQQQFRMPEHVIGEVASIVNRGDTPYRTPSDLYRDAINHRLHYINKVYVGSDRLQSMLDIEKRATQLEADRREIDAHKAYLENVKRVLDDAKEFEDWGLLKDTVKEIREDTVKMRSPWDKRTLELCEKYEAILEEVGQ